MIITKNMKDVVHLDDLTVYIISSGEDTENDCVAALQAQSCSFKIEFIRNVCPMSKAFQSMPDRCSTKFFLQVDADMILEKEAVYKLYTAIVNSPFWIYCITGQLFEEGFGVGGAVKCWKKSLFNFISFRNKRTVDRDLYSRLRWFGLRTRKITDVLGIHRPRHSDFSLYLKAKSDVEKWRYLKRPSNRYALSLIEEVLDQENISPYQLLGVLTGAITIRSRVELSKDSLLEASRFNNILFLFYQSSNSELLFCNIEKIDKDELVAAFVDSYDDFYAQRVGKRNLLANKILNIYSNSARDLNKPVISLLEILDK